MAGKQGMKIQKSHEDSPRFTEYWKKENPNWTMEQCEHKAKWFRKSCNYQCIEYYERHYPELSHEQHLQKRKELQEKKKTNNPLYFPYYQKHYPNLSKEEQEKLWHQYTRSINYQCVEYYEAKGLSKEQAKIKRDKFVKEIGEKISKKISGEGNGMHRSKTTQEKRNAISPWNIAFYKRKYPNLSHEEHLKLQQEFFDKNKIAVKNAIKDTNIEYYLQQGMSKEQAKEALAERQRTFSLEKCIEKYGEVEGRKKYLERQTKWKSSLQKSFNHSGSPYTQSNISLKMISDLCNKLKINVPKDELCLINNNSTNKVKNHYFYDFVYKNKIIEFNGDYWHCNPKTWTPDKYNKSLHMTAQEVWAKDLDKKICAESYGYEVLTVWDSDYKETPDNVINKCIDFINS